MNNFTPLTNFSFLCLHRQRLDYFLEIFFNRNMMKKPGLGKRKRVTQSQSEAEDQPEQPEKQDELPDTQASDPGDTATQATQSHRRYKKKRLVRMTDAQEDKMAEWLQNHPEMYNKGKKEYRDLNRKEAAWAIQASAMGSELHLPLYY